MHLRLHLTQVFRQVSVCNSGMLVTCVSRAGLFQLSVVFRKASRPLLLHLSFTNLMFHVYNNSQLCSDMYFQQFKLFGQQHLNALNLSWAKKPSPFFPRKATELRIAEICAGIYRSCVGNGYHLSYKCSLGSKQLPP